MHASLRLEGRHANVQEGQRNGVPTIAAIAPPERPPLDAGGRAGRDPLGASKQEGGRQAGLPGGGAPLCWPGKPVLKVAGCPPLPSPPEQQ